MNHLQQSLNKIFGLRSARTGPRKATPKQWVFDYVDGEDGSVEAVEPTKKAAVALRAQLMADGIECSEVSPEY